MLNRNISAATGVSASTEPAISPAAGPDRRRTAAYTTATVPTPISTSGTRTDQGERPKIRTASAIGHSAAGGLSTVMALPASSEPKKNAFQDWLPACTAAE
ncbi:hypothetical protein STENM36S_06529 [Streptomyces tendae]